MPETVHIYIETDSISPREIRRRYGYVLECKVLENTRTRDGFGTVEGTWNKAVLTALSEALERLVRPCEVHVHTRNGYVLGMMENNLEHWAAAGFIGSRGRPVANREEWESVWRLIQEHLWLSEPSGPEGHSYSRWLLGEMGREAETHGKRIDHGAVESGEEKEKGMDAGQTEGAI